MLIVLPLLFASVDSRAQELRAGYAKVDVTPTVPVFMGGYDLRGEPSNGVHGHDRLYVRALVFDASGVRVAFITPSPNWRSQSILASAFGEGAAWL